VKSRISGKDADTRHQFWEPALSHGCPPGLWAGEGRSCSHALVAVRPVTDLLRIANCLLLETLPAFTIFLSAPRQHDLTGTAAALRPQPGGIDPGTVHRRSDKGRPLVRASDLHLVVHHQRERVAFTHRDLLRAVRRRCKRQMCDHCGTPKHVTHATRSRAGSFFSGLVSEIQKSFCKLVAMSE
jgi:hypothetical protein